jgi:hypothetical protein
MTYMTKKLLSCVFSLFCLFLFATVLQLQVLQAQTVSVSSLLDEMLDRNAITKFPEPAFTCLQASSYDRRAKSPTDNWFANGDASQFLRDEMNGDR